MIGKGSYAVKLVKRKYPLQNIPDLQGVLAGI
jgi:hypothetical protein